jgi:hypothetical protein
MTNRLDDSQAWAVLLNHLLTTYIPTNLTPEFLDELSGSLSEARSRVGMVPDGVHDTIRSNLMLASAWADSEDLTDFCVRVVFNHTTMGTPIDTAIRYALNVGCHLILYSVDSLTTYLSADYRATCLLYVLLRRCMSYF